MKFAERIDLSWLRLLFVVLLFVSWAEAFGVAGERTSVSPSRDLSRDVKWLRRESLNRLKGLVV